MHWNVGGATSRAAAAVPEGPQSCSAIDHAGCHGNNRRQYSEAIKRKDTFAFVSILFW